MLLLGFSAGRRSVNHFVGIALGLLLRFPNEL